MFDVTFLRAKHLLRAQLCRNFRPDITTVFSILNLTHNAQLLNFVSNCNLKFPTCRYAFEKL